MRLRSRRPFTLYLQGGLGNQLFQACVYFFLREHCEAKCVVNPSLLAGVARSITSRKLESSFLFENGDIVPSSSPILTGLALRTHQVFGRLYVEQSDDVGFWRSLPDSKFLHLLGYFQDWRLAELAWPNIYEKMRLEKEWGFIVQGALQERVVIHYRLGDYVTNSGARRHHGVTDPSFFTQQIKQITRKHGDLEVVVVSDDPDLAKALFQIHAGEVDATFRTAPGHLDDLAFIAASSHVIMSNSSYSWWGAWISSKKGGRVIAPRPWFARKVTPNGLLPPSWRNETRTVISDDLLDETLTSIGRHTVGR